MARLTVGDFEDLQRQLLRTREELCSSQVRERAAVTELGRLRTELSDLTLYSNLQATRESLLREDTARLHHALERCTGDPGAASGLAGACGSFPPPPTPNARRRMEVQVGSAAAQITRLEAEREVLRISLGHADADELSSAQLLTSGRALLASSRAEQHHLVSLLRDRERALHEMRQVAAALHVRVSRSDSVAASELASLSAAKSSSEELGSAYRDAQRVAASQHALVCEQLRALKRASAARMARHAAETTSRMALRGWRHTAEVAQLFRQLKALSYGSLLASRPAGGADAPPGASPPPLASAGEQAGAAPQPGPGAPAAEPPQTPLQTPRAPPAPVYVDREEAVRSLRLRRWWSAELGCLRAELSHLDRQQARQAGRAAAEEGALSAALASAEREASLGRATTACALSSLGSAESELRRQALLGCRARAEAALLAAACAQADGALRACEAALLAREQQLADLGAGRALQTRRADAQLRQLQRSLREEVAQHRRAQEELACVHAEPRLLRRASSGRAGADGGSGEPDRAGHETGPGPGGPRAPAEQQEGAEAGWPHAAPQLPSPPSLAGSLSWSAQQRELDSDCASDSEPGPHAEAEAQAQAELAAGALGSAAACSLLRALGGLDPDPPAAQQPQAALPAQPLPQARSSGAAAGGSGAWGELALGPPAAPHCAEQGGAFPSLQAAALPSWLEAVRWGARWAVAESPAAEAGALQLLELDSAALVRAPPPASAAPEPADGVSPEALLLKLRHLSAQNGFLRERVSHLEESVLELHRDVAKKRTLMRHLYSAANGPLPPNTSEGVRNSLVHRWVQTLISPTVGSLQQTRSALPAQREREISDAMEVVLEETLYKNMQLQTDIETLGAQCVRLRRLLAEVVQPPQPTIAGTAGVAPEGESGGPCHADPNSRAQ